MKDHNMEPCACPNCKAPLDAATGIGHDVAPVKDDWTMCMYCGVFLRFTDDIKLRSVEQSEIDELKVCCPNEYTIMVTVREKAQAYMEARKAWSN